MKYKHIPVSEQTLIRFRRLKPLVKLKPWERHVTDDRLLNDLIDDREQKEADVKP